MNQEHHNKKTRFNNIGVNASNDKLYIGATDKGFYIDCLNGRTRSLEGSDGDSIKIKGEEIFFNKVSVLGDWLNLVSVSINNRIFQISVDKLGVQDPIITIDNVIVASSDKIPFTKDFPIQFDTNEGCDFGEIFLTDNNSSPVFLGLEDMLDAVGTDKYFEGFNLDRYSVNLDKPLDIPVFVGLENVGGGGGAPVGNYQYSIAYVDSAGNRTSLSEKTPVIPVVRSLSSGSRVFPWSKTFGDSPNSSSNTSYAPKIRFRVTNYLDYDSIEIVRYSYNNGEGLNFTPTAIVVGRVSISPGQVDIIDFIDFVDSDREIVLSDEEELSQGYLIQRAKGIRYFNNRVELANISTVEKTDESTFSSFNGKKIFPILEKLFKAGHKNPYNHAYRSSEMGGERVTYGIHYWDSVGGRSFVKTDDELKNVEYPNRRDPMGSDSINFSYGGRPPAGSVAGTPAFVFESFDNESAVRRSDRDNFKNILSKGSRTNSTVNENGGGEPDDYQAAQSGTTWRAPYLPFRSTNKNESGDTMDMMPNVEVDGNGFLGGGSKFNYDPQGFALDYYAKGHALSGIENFPDWAKAFSVVRTESAGRVICQGLGMYKINPGSYSGSSSDKNTRKSNSGMWFHSPDIDSGLVSQEQIDDIKNNPNDYKVQFVSPLGFFTETYSFESNNTKDHLVDMLVHANVMRDNGQINPGLNPTSDPLGYVYHNKFRNITTSNGGWFTGSDGNKEMGIDFVESIFEGRGDYFHLGFQQNIYQTKTVGGSSKRDFDDAGLMNWTEPFYMVNIIKSGATVPDNDIQGYKSTGTYIKKESIIGKGDGSSLQQFPLVDERWEDCCQRDAVVNPDRFIYLRDINSRSERRFTDATAFSALQLTNAQNDIIANGFFATASGENVVGFYRHTKEVADFNRNHDFTVIFDIAGSLPTDQEYIVVKYDNRIPIKFFGGDTYVGDSIFAPIDREVTLSNNSDDPEETEQFVLNVGFPYGRYKMNPRYYRVKDATGVDKIQNSDWHSFSHIRQMCVMFNCDNRISSHYAHSDVYPNEFYPQTAYVMRPNVWDADEDILGNNIFRDYIADYSASEKDRWPFGGFRFSQQYNVDYSNRGRVEFFSKPEIGFEEEFEFCNRVIWSLAKSTNQQDSPSLKTFLVGNTFDIEDRQGEIKFLYGSNESDKGSNLYAITERGVCLLLTNKSILSNINGDNLTTQASDSFIAQEYWIERDIGSHGEMWRGKSEGTFSTPGDSGDSLVQFLAFPNRDSVYMLVNNSVKNIGNKKYASRIRPFLNEFPLDYSKSIVGGFDKQYDEYYLYIDKDTSNQDLHIFSLRSFFWIGRRDYRFDTYFNHNSSFYGARNLETYKLEEGYKINGLPINYELTQIVSSADVDMEFIRVFIETGGRNAEKPVSVQFLDPNTGAIMCELSEAARGTSLYLKMYDTWEQFIPRMDASFNSLESRIQDRLLIYKIIHNLEADFKIVNTIIQVKDIK